MSALLAVETSGPLCSLAIHVAGRWFEDTQNVERLHNRVVLNILQSLTVSAGVRRKDFDAVAFGAGPGSFTGIRIAAAVAQGVAFACNALVLPVRSSQALAAVVERDSRWPQAERVLTVTRSRRDAYYVAGYSFAADGVPVQFLDDRLHQGDEAPPDVLDVPWPGVGDRPPWWPAVRPFLDDVPVTARAVGELGLQMKERGEGLPAHAALPVYVSGDSPWRPMQT